MIPRNFRRMVEMVVRAMHDAFLPPGTIVATGRATIPSGWLYCDGTAHSRSVYANLFAAIGTTYGVGDSSTTFNVPNIKGKVPVGSDATQAEFDTLGETGGAKTHQLTQAEMPAHAHNAFATVLGQTGAGAYALTGTTAIGVGIQETGGDGAHNNLQPYVTVNYMIKY